jgi:hypothetical protein
MLEIFDRNPQEAEIIISALKDIPSICALLTIAAELICKKTSKDHGEKSEKQKQPETPAPRKHSSKKAGGSLDYE